MKNLTKVKILRNLTMFGADACEIQLLTEYFKLEQSADTGNDTLNAVFDIARVSACLAVSVATAYATNIGIGKLFEDAECEARNKDLLEANKK